MLYAGIVGGLEHKTQRIPLVAWDSICKPKNKGGLSVKNCRIWNMEVICRQNLACSSKERLSLGEMGKCNLSGIILQKLMHLGTGGKSNKLN